MLNHDPFARLCRARDMLRQVNDRPWTIEEVARAAAMSPFHFIRQFTALFGDTPHQYRLRARLDRAKHLLAVEHRSVTCVCMDVGYSSVGTFSDLFARRVGMPPSAYQRRARAMVAVPGIVPKELFPGCLALMGAAFATFEKHSRQDFGQTQHHANQADQHPGR
jgi:AraC-like DNA-binding protein